MDAIAVKNLVKHFPLSSGFWRRRTGSVHAVNSVSFEIPKATTFGLVGESGSGKSTIGKLLMQIHPYDSGSARLNGDEIQALKKRDRKSFYRRIQMIFQDPYSSLNPRHTIGEILSRPLKAYGIPVADTPEKLLNKVKLGSWALRRYPHEFSGGQRQRIAVARALTLNPEVIIADEPVSALDVSVQSQVLNLLKDIQEEFQITMLFIAHDLAVVRHMSDRIGVLYLGKLVEVADREDIFESPRHPYTKALLSANPAVHGKKKEKLFLKGEIPSPVNLPTGCAFHTRCPFAFDRCKSEAPELRTSRKPTQIFACHLEEK